MPHAAVDARATELQDSAWLSRLAGSHPGRVLQNHLACVEHHLESQGRSGPVLEAKNKRTAFLQALCAAAQRDRPHPCGLPSPMPRYVALVNLSGERLMLCSDESAMMRSLCGRSTVLHPEVLGRYLLDFVTWLGAHPKPAPDSRFAREAFVLVTFVLPWQAGLACTYWEVDTVVLDRAPNGNSVNVRISDRTLSLTSHSPAVFCGRPTMADSWETLPLPLGKTLDFLGPKQVKEFCDTYRACWVDHAPRSAEAKDRAPDAAAGWTAGATLAGGPNVSALSSMQSDHLRQVVKGVSADRTKLLARIHELEEERKTLALAHETQAAAMQQAFEHEKKVQFLTDQERIATIATERDELRTERDGMRTSQASLLTENSKLRKEQRDARRAKEEKERKAEAQVKVTNAALNKHLATIKSLQERLETQEREGAKSAAEADKAHAAALARAASGEDKKLASLRASIESKERIINQLSENNDRKDAEKIAIEQDVTDLRADARRTRAHSRIGLWAMRAAVRNAKRALRAAPPPPRISDAASAARSVGTDPVSTDTVGTATHHCAVTQTADPRVLPEHLPTGVGVLPAPAETGAAISPVIDDAVTTKADAPLAAASPTASTTTTGDTATVSDPPADPNNAHAYDAASDPHVAAAHAHAAMASIQHLVEYTSRLQQQCMHDEHATHVHAYHDPHLQKHHHHHQHNTAHSPMHAQALHQQVLPHFVSGYAFGCGPAAAPVRFAPAEAQQQQSHHHHYQHHHRSFGPEPPPWRHGRGGGGGASARPHRGGGGR